MNILFVCKFNRFRSKFAEAIFNKLNKNPKNKAKSAGLIIGNPTSKTVWTVAKEKGLKLNPKPQGLSVKLLKWADLTVIVANDFPNGVLKAKNSRSKIIKLNIHDCGENDIKRIKIIIKQIESEVIKLIR